ncbi:MAG TPA: hypothetical protein VKT77_05610 [Chthonomonadaceae bacterium]|nr:hypothetical protein [Chthonomonadaceae bacterium]
MSTVHASQETRDRRPVSGRTGPAVAAAAPANLPCPTAGANAQHAAQTGSTDAFALGAGLPWELDARLKSVLVEAETRCKRRACYPADLVRAFASGSYTSAQLDELIDAVDLRRAGIGPRSQLCAWILGLPTLRAADRSRAARALREALSYDRRKSQTRGERLRTIGLTAVRLLALIPILLFALEWLVELHLLGDFAVYLVSVAASWIAVVLVCLLPLVRFGRIHEIRFIAAHALGRLQDVQSIGALSGACRDRDHFTARMARQSLRVILPHVTHHHYGQLGASTIPSLCDFLREGFRGELAPGSARSAFTAVVLAAVGNVGDQRAIPLIEHGLTLWKDISVREAAARALEQLEERQRQETARATLLRGTAQPAVPDSDLLRAAAGQPPAQPDGLLRPAVATPRTSARRDGAG